MTAGDQRSETITQLNIRFCGLTPADCLLYDSTGLVFLFILLDMVEGTSMIDVVVILWIEGSLLALLSI